MSDIKYICLPKQVDNEALLARVKELRTLRLLSLQTDAKCFISRYEDEVDQPIEFWLNRHQEPEVEHFIAQLENKPDEETVDNAMPKYVACLVLLRRGHGRPEAPDSALSVSSDQNSATDQLPEYSMEALYVEPQFRRRGISVRLIQEMMQWIGEDSRKAKMDKAKIVTTVAEGNVSAKNIYLKQGFNVVSHTNVQDKAGNPRAVMKMEFIMDCGGT